MRLRRRGGADAPGAPDPVAEAAAQHLSEAIRIPTVTPPDGPLSDAVRAPFDLFRTFLEDTYARTFETADVEVVGRAGLLLRIAGETDDRPVLLMAHQDVVPVPADWEAEGWEHPPFDGVVADGHVHGRGSLDDKGALITLLEAVEGLLTSGWTPARDLLLFFGADEESSHGTAAALSGLLAERGIEPWLTVDEGGAVATGAFPGIKQPLAVIGATEKGALTVRLTASSTGGHASTPPRTSAPGILARAILAIEATPAPAAVHDLTVEMFEQIAPHAPRTMRGLLARAGSLRGVLSRALPRLSPELGAVVRTTYAITQLEGSPADNVLATRASAVVNSRVAVGSSTKEALAHLRGAIDDERITLEVLEAFEPSPVSPTGDDDRWAALREAVAASYPEAIAVPYIMLAASDGRYAAQVSPAVYRFAPLLMDKAQREAIHGPDEHVSIDSLGRAVAFYKALLIGPALASRA